MEPRRIDLDALLTAHAFMRVERPPELWQVDVEDEPFIRMLGEMIVVGLLHHDVLADLTLNAADVTVGDDAPDGVAPGDYVAFPGDVPHHYEALGVELNGEKFAFDRAVVTDVVNDSTTAAGNRAIGFQPGANPAKT